MFSMLNFFFILSVVPPEMMVIHVKDFIEKPFFCCSRMLTGAASPLSSADSVLWRKGSYERAKSNPEINVFLMELCVDGV